jgi:hypothetical protein
MVQWWATVNVIMDLLGSKKKGEGEFEYLCDYSLHKVSTPWRWYTLV